MFDETLFSSIGLSYNSRNGEAASMPTHKYFHDVLRLPKVVNFRGGAIKAATDRGIVFDSYTYGY